MYAAAASLSRTGGRSARITARSARSPRERGSSSPPGLAAPSDPISTNFARGFPDSATAAVSRSHAVLTRRYGGSHRPRKVRLWPRHWTTASAPATSAASSSLERSSSEAWTTSSPRFWLRPGCTSSRASTRRSFERATAWCAPAGEAAGVRRRGRRGCPGEGGWGSTHRAPVAPLQELGADVAAGGPRGPHHHDALAGAHALPRRRDRRSNRVTLRVLGLTRQVWGSWGGCQPPLRRLCPPSAATLRAGPPRVRRSPRRPEARSCVGNACVGRRREGPGREGRRRRPAALAAGAGASERSSR